MTRIILQETATRAPAELDKKETKDRTIELLRELDDLQNLLYAESKHAVLVVLQGMDASGKDGLIRQVFGRMNPLGVRARAFKEPTAEELSHDFLWRVHRHAPARGMMHVFNRSHYEDVLITRVHGLCGDALAAKRMQAINDFEKLLQEHNDTHILKFYLHVSPEEQHKRLEERMKDPSKMWKYNKNDLKEAGRWKEYARMYEDCFEHCNDPEWIIVPADQNWYKEYIVAKTLCELLRSLHMQFPRL